MQKFLKPEYVPSQKFIQQNILLIPADKVPRKMDLAFLSYEFEGKIFMIVKLKLASKLLSINCQ